MELKLFIATKAFILYNKKVLVLRESSAYDVGTQTGKCDVPGGRLTPGETYDQALLREVQEETGLQVTISNPFFVNEVRRMVKSEEWQIVRIFFMCSSGTDHVTLSKDHDQYLWIDPADYKSSNVIENLYPAFDALLDTLGGA